MIYRIVYRQGSVEFSIDPFLWAAIFLGKQKECYLHLLSISTLYISQSPDVTKPHND